MNESSTQINREEYLVHAWRRVLKVLTITGYHVRIHTMNISRISCNIYRGETERVINISYTCTCTKKCQKCYNFSKYSMYMYMHKLWRKNSKFWKHQQNLNASNTCTSAHTFLTYFQFQKKRCWCSVRVEREYCVQHWIPSLVENSTSWEANGEGKGRGGRVGKGRGGEGRGGEGENKK